MGNLGVSGFSPQQSLLVLTRFGVPRRPELVLFAIFEGNDVDDTTHYRAYRESHLRWDAFVSAITRVRASSQTWSRYQSSRLWTIMPSPSPRPARSAGVGEHRLNPVVGQIQGREVEIAFDGLLLYRTTRSREQWETSDGWPMLTDVLDRARQHCADAGVEMAVVLFPSKESLYPALLDRVIQPDEFGAFVEASAPPGATPAVSWFADHLRNRYALHQLLVDHLDDKGFTYIDLVPGFAAAAARGEALYWPFDTHLSTSGNALAAELVLEGLRLVEEPSPQRPGA